MITPTSSDPKKLLGLAERMGIPADEAVRRVLEHLTDQAPAPDEVERVPASDR
jgi:hypothetical protein